MPGTAPPPRLPAFDSFGAALKYLRRRARLSQRELSIAVGYSESQISRFESQQRPPDLATLRARFVPALGLDDQPAAATHLLQLAASARGERNPAQASAAPADTPAGQPWSDSGKPPQAFPTPLTSFVGREREIADIQRLLLEQHPVATRLVTLTGTGGSGKTRLALQVMLTVRADYPGAAWLVELAPLADPAFVPQAVATALGVREVAGQPLTQALVDYLRPRSAVLVLDNCEHVINACAALVEALLRGCPGLKLLATSREALGVLGETPYAVQPLALPTEAAAPDDEYAQAEAVLLFVDRARAVRPDFGLTHANLTVAAHICRRLDGIPLAIELAAARLRALTQEQVANRLDDRFRLLIGGNRGALPRQQTLRATFDWSHDLLPDLERTLFRRLAVFQGGWDLEACEVVCAGAGLERGLVLGLLMRLVDKSLVVAEDRGHAMRYRLLDTVRQYAHEKLVEQGEAESYRRQHLHYYADLAEQAGPHLDGPEAGHWMPRLDADLDNLRAAMQWSLKGDVLTGLRLATPLGTYWWLRSGDDATVRWFNLALLREAEDLADRPRPPKRALLRALALRVAGHLTYYANTWEQYGQEVPLLEESLALYRDAGTVGRVGMAFALRNLGRSALDVPDYERAQALGEAGLTLSRETGKRDMVAQCLVLLGRVAMAQGEFSRAQALFEAAIAENDQIGNVVGNADCAYWAGEAAFNHGDLDAATELFVHSIALHSGLGGYGFISLSQSRLAAIEIARGHMAEARARYGAAITAGQMDNNNPFVLALAAHGLGRLAAQAGTYAEAVVHLRKALTNLQSCPDPNIIARLLDSLAEAAAGQRQAVRAAQLLGAADGFYARRPICLPPPEQAAREATAAATRALLGNAGFEQHRAEGRALAGRAAIAYALGEKT